jgi:hypothetical protein
MNANIIAILITDDVGFITTADGVLLFAANRSQNANWSCESPCSPSKIQFMFQDILNWKTFYFSSLMR